MTPDSPHMKLAKALRSRRIELGYMTLASFMRAMGVEKNRTLGKLESGVRKKYWDATYSQVEGFYQWERGSILRLLEEDEAPTPLPGSPGAAQAETPAEQPSGWTDEVLQILSSRFADDTKLKMIRDVVDRHRQAPGSDGS